MKKEKDMAMVAISFCLRVIFLLSFKSRMLTTMVLTEHRDVF